MTPMVYAAFEQLAREGAAWWRHVRRAAGSALAERDRAAEVPAAGEGRPMQIVPDERPARRAA